MSTLVEAIKAAREEIDGGESCDYSGEALALWSRLTDLLDALTGEAFAEALLPVIMRHHTREGIMCSMSHWAYKHPEGKWFSHCSSDDRVEAVGCGWESEPHCYPTREEAHAASIRHLFDTLMGALS